MSKIEHRYSAYDCEPSAVLFSVKKFRCYVEGSHFTVITDYNALKWLNSKKEGRVAKWIMKLQQYSYDLIHWKSKYAPHVVPDAVSRVELFNSIYLNNLDQYNLRMRKLKVLNSIPNGN